MTPPGALAVTAGLLAFLALILAIAAEEAPRASYARRFAVAGWLVLVVAVASAVASVWWEAYS